MELLVYQDLTTFYREFNRFFLQVSMSTEVGSAEKLVLLLMIDKSQQTDYLPNTHIAAELGMSLPTVIKARRNLADKKLIIQTKNRYKVDSEAVSLLCYNALQRLQHIEY